MQAKMYANVKRLSQRPGGRSPRFHQIWQVRPFWPIRASSWKNRRMRLPLCVSAILLSSDGALFKGRLCGRVFFRMARPPLLSRKPQLAQNAAHRGHVQALAEPLLANAHKILARERRKPARLRVGPGKHDANEFRLLLGFELRR